VSRFGPACVRSTISDVAATRHSNHPRFRMTLLDCLAKPGCRNLLSGLQHCALDDDGPEGAGKIAVRPSIKKAADTQASARKQRA
jgi:hypothetical protein